jgi:hypothetical protein
MTIPRNMATLGTEDEEVRSTLAALMSAIGDKRPLGEISRLYVKHILAVRGGNKSHASETLRVDRRSLQRWQKGEQQPFSRAKAPTNNSLRSQVAELTEKVTKLESQATV